MLNKRGVFILLLVSVLMVSFVSAEEDIPNGIEDTTDDTFVELEQEYEDEEIVDPGITPDSAFYFIDDFFDRFGDQIENKEEIIDKLTSNLKLELWLKQEIMKLLEKH